MKIIAIATFIAATAYADGRVTVCVAVSGELRDYVTRFAGVRSIVIKAYAAIGVSINWYEASRPCVAARDTVIRVAIIPDPRDIRSPSVLAASRPYEATHIEIFYNRVVSAVERPNVPSLLAHVLIHEIAHIFQRIKRHSAEGMMKAR